MEKEEFDDECECCEHGWFEAARLSADPYNDEPAEYGCDLDYECPYLDDGSEEDSEEDP
jgi:hypothetical protein